MKISLLALFFICAMGGLNIIQAQEQSYPESRRPIHRFSFDEWGNIALRDENSRLDNVAALLRRDSKLVAHIIAYSGRRYCPGEAQARAIRAKNYLVNVDGINFNRVIWRDGGYREWLTMEIWIKLREEPEPGTSPTLRPINVRIKKGCKRNRRGKS